MTINHSSSSRACDSTKKKKQKLTTIDIRMTITIYTTHYTSLLVDVNCHSKLTRVDQLGTRT